MKVTERINELRGFTEDDLKSRAKELDEQVFRLRIQKSMGQTQAGNKMRPLRRELRGPYLQRWEARSGDIAHVRAELPEAVDQVADRALVHARHARQAVLAVAERERRGQRAKSGAGVAEEQVRFLLGEWSADSQNLPF